MGARHTASHREEAGDREGGPQGVQEGGAEPFGQTGGLAQGEGAVKRGGGHVQTLDKRGSMEYQSALCLAKIGGRALEWYIFKGSRYTWGAAFYFGGGVIFDREVYEPIMASTRRGVPRVKIDLG